MSPWQCAIRGCGTHFADAEDVLVHQATEHDPHVCEICSAEVPEGYFAIRHALEEHSRAEYVRAYDAGPDDIRERETIRAGDGRRLDGGRQARSQWTALKGERPENGHPVAVLRGRETARGAGRRTHRAVAEPRERRETDVEARVSVLRNLLTARRAVRTARGAIAPRCRARESGRRGR